MKLSKFLFSLSALACGVAIQGNAQETLPEVTIVATSYKYLNAVGNKDQVAQPVRMLEQKAATYDVKKADFYEDDYDQYFVSFFIPDGKILAAYDRNGKLLRTAEKFKNVNLPDNVRQAVIKRFPNWNITKDAYLVTYYSADGTANKKYKLLLENGDQRIKVRSDDKGNIED